MGLKIRAQWSVFFRGWIFSRILRAFGWQQYARRDFSCFFLFAREISKIIYFAKIRGVRCPVNADIDARFSSIAYACAKKNRTINFTDLSAVIAWLYFVSAKMRLHLSFYFQLFKPFFIIRKFKGRFAVHIMV